MKSEPKHLDRNKDGRHASTSSHQLEEKPEKWALEHSSEQKRNWSEVYFGFRSGERSCRPWFQPFPLCSVSIIYPDVFCCCILVVINKWWKCCRCLVCQRMHYRNEPGPALLGADLVNKRESDALVSAERCRMKIHKRLQFFLDILFSWIEQIGSVTAHKVRWMFWLQLNVTDCSTFPSET